MPKIHLLPSDVISKIAAGEVIERPASVLKETVENSLDAGATRVEVNLKEAGKTLICIKDNGTGIEREDMENIFIRHSTSKISDIDDLFNIASLGFRGEALYSIAAISDVLLRSKTANQDSGWELHIRAGKRLSLRPVTMQNGTEIEINELFFNTPARRKFLKTDTTEINQIISAFTPYTLFYPGSRFLLTHNDSVLIELAPAENRLKRSAEALNLEPENIIAAMRDYPKDNISIQIILGNINIQRNRKDMQFIFINNRPVQNRALSFHINQAYRLVMPEGASPFFAVFVDMPKESVDINIHPAKREVKIKDENRLGGVLRSLCELTLMSDGKPKQITGALGQTPQKEPFPAVKTSGFSFHNAQKIIAGSDSEIQDTTPQGAPPDSESIKEFLFEESAPTEAGARPENNEAKFSAKDNTLRDKFANARYIGVFIKKYLIFEAPSSILVIDQHAAQERITYEKLKAQVESGKVEVQHLLSPIIIKLTPQEILLWEETKENLEKIGFLTTLFDKESLALHAYPHLILNPEFSLRGLLIDNATVKAGADALARRACRSSLMSGYDIKTAEAQYLKDQLTKCFDPFTCPHGRPTVIEIEEKFLNKQFLRQ